MQFHEKLKNCVHTNNSLVCVGLDIDTEKIPRFLCETYKDPYVKFNTMIIDATKDLVCAYKLNMAFYEILGKQGYELLEKTIHHIPKDIVVILDGKRNDIGNTAQKYAQTMFEQLHADAATVNPYLGIDGIAPFLSYKDKCSFILCRTSNPSAGDLQDLKINNLPLYHHVAEKIKTWNEQGCCGAVVGATYPVELQKIRAILGNDMPFLIPGIGKQGGDIEKTVSYGTNAHKEMAIINSSREILYAGSDDCFAESARAATEKLRAVINKYR